MKLPGMMMPSSFELPSLKYKREEYENLVGTAYLIQLDRKKRNVVKLLPRKEGFPCKKIERLS